MGSVTKRGIIVLLISLILILILIFLEQIIFFIIMLKMYWNTVDVKYDSFLSERHPGISEIKIYKEFIEEFLKKITNSLSKGNKEEAKNITLEYLFYFLIESKSKINMPVDLLKSRFRENLTILCSIMDDIINNSLKCSIINKIIIDKYYSLRHYLLIKKDYLFMPNIYSCADYINQTLQIYQELCKNNNNNNFVLFEIITSACSEYILKRVAKKKNKDIYIIHMETTNVEPLLCGLAVSRIFKIYNTSNVSEFIVIYEYSSKLYTCDHYIFSPPTCYPCIKSENCDLKYLLSLSFS